MDASSRHERGDSTLVHTPDTPYNPFALPDSVQPKASGTLNELSGIGALEAVQAVPPTAAVMPRVGQRLNLHESQATKGLAPLLSQPEFRLAHQHTTYTEKISHWQAYQQACHTLQWCLTHQPTELSATGVTALHQALKRQQHWGQLQEQRYQHQLTTVEEQLLQELLQRWPKGSHALVSLGVWGIRHGWLYWQYGQHTLKRLGIRLGQRLLGRLGLSNPVAEPTTPPPVLCQQVRQQLQGSPLPAEAYVWLQGWCLLSPTNGATASPFTALGKQSAVGGKELNHVTATSKRHAVEGIASSVTKRS
ncbi:MAG: hypothetical protein ACKO34_08445 [Vampirovibrionales bacterium]